MNFPLNEDNTKSREDGIGIRPFPCVLKPGGEENVFLFQNSEVIKNAFITHLSRVGRNEQFHCALHSICCIKPQNMFLIKLNRKIYFNMQYI